MTSRSQLQELTGFENRRESKSRFEEEKEFRKALQLLSMEADSSQIDYGLDLLEVSIHDLENTKLILENDGLGKLYEITARHELKESVRLKAIIALGAMLGNNQRLQNEALNLKIMEFALENLDSEVSLKMAKSWLYFISSYVTNFETGANRLIDEDGIYVIKRVYDRFFDPSIHIKCWIILNELQRQTNIKMDNKVDWCDKRDRAAVDLLQKRPDLKETFEHSTAWLNEICSSG